MTTIKIADIPDSCLAENGDIFVEGLMAHLGAAMRFRSAGKQVQQFKNNPVTNDDGYRDIATAGWGPTEDGEDVYIISLMMRLPSDHESETYPTYAHAVRAIFDGEVPDQFKKTPETP